jgi:uncharacterized protein
MASYKTPGVYVEEIAKFPPSVAQVETAIPAFIGFTEIAKRKSDGDLSGVPTRITSMLEFATYFGGPEPETAIGVEVFEDGSLTVSLASRSNFLMYYSMQLYFANGGGPCYIVSVGDYSGGVSLTPMEDGLAEILKVDEPTLLLFPDATSLPSSVDFYGIYSSALQQCAKLQDRFTIIDTYTDEDATTPISVLRNGISLENDFLKYGAAYFPYLNTILDYVYNDADVDITDNTLRDYEAEAQAIADTILTASLETLLTDLRTLGVDVATAAAPAALAMKPSIITKVNEIKTYLSGVGSKLMDVVALAKVAAASPSSPSDPTIVLANALDKWVTDNIEALDVALNSRIDDINAIGTKTGLVDLVTDTSNAAIDSLYELLGLDTVTIADSDIIQDISDLKTADELFDLIAGLASVSSSGPSTYTLASIKSTDTIMYNKIRSEISLLPIKLPPSSAMAGIYARVDNLRGVWKAPANVGVTYVSSPSLNVTHDEQADMNVHTTGKSINAIRTFTGKGIMVWGARTLAGNDNEWRYVPVRRFFNMVEESVKKASEQFVFEGNDANTWVRIRAMIENFLNLQWRAGALTGSKPEQAYYVRVGLGQTMTAEDILNGYMNIEIGMAVVRPAEFIVLKFSHKMQEA